MNKKQFTNTPKSAEARVRSQVSSCGIFGGQNGNDAGFLWGLRFPPPILIPPTAPYSLIAQSSMLYSLDPDSVVM
jgi:hypothetical protein